MEKKVSDAVKAMRRAGDALANAHKDENAKLVDDWDHAVDRMVTEWDKAVKAEIGAKFAPAAEKRCRSCQQNNRVMGPFETELCGPCYNKGIRLVPLSQNQQQAADNLFEVAQRVHSFHARYDSALPVPLMADLERAMGAYVAPWTIEFDKKPICLNPCSEIPLPTPRLPEYTAPHQPHKFRFRDNPTEGNGCAVCGGNPEDHSLPYIAPPEGVEITELVSKEDIACLQAQIDILRAAVGGKMDDGEWRHFRQLMNNERNRSA